MSPNEEENEEEQPIDEGEESIEDSPDEPIEDLDTQKELDRLRFHYRGYTLEELKKMNMDQFIQLLPARARRSLIRWLPPRHKKLLERLRRSYRAKKKGERYRHSYSCKRYVNFPRNGWTENWSI